MAAATGVGALPLEALQRRLRARLAAPAIVLDMSWQVTETMTIGVLVGMLVEGVAKKGEADEKTKS
jgi:hypothetical protein